MTIPIDFFVLGRPATVNRKKTKKDWTAAVKAAATAAVAAKNPPAGGPTGAETMVKVFWFPTNGVYADVDNGLKATLDAMSGIIFHDDRAVQRVVAHRFRSEPGSSMVINASAAATLLSASACQYGFFGVRSFATAIKVESYIASGGAWW